MRSTHRSVLAVALAVSAAAGTAAVAQTVHLGADAKKPATISASALKAQKAKLAAADRSIDSALGAKPPKLPPVPKFAPLPAPSVPPAVVTRVVPVASSTPAAAETRDGSTHTDAPADDSPSPETHRSRTASPAPAATTPAAAAAPAAPAAPAQTGEDGEDHHGSVEDHPEDHAPEPQSHDD